MRADADQSWLVFGSVGRPHGVKGEVRLHAYNSEAEIPPHLNCPVEVRLKSGVSESARTLLTIRGARGEFFIRIQEAETRERIADWVNYELLLPRECFPPLRPGEFYVEDVHGCNVYTPDGTMLGPVVSVYWNGAQDIMQIAAISGEELLIPVVHRYVLSVDQSRRMIVVDLDD